MSFSAEWLALREPVDHRSRNAALARALQQHFAGRASLRITDFGCGTGSNLRATFALLPDEQHWTLVDYDQTLLDAARAALEHWADDSRQANGSLALRKSGKRLDVAFRRIDLNRDLAAALAPAPELVTASALFDLISERWIANFAQQLAQLGCAFYTVLTYDGRDAFAPVHPLDHAVVAAFAAHQGGDKGFGPAAGPRGADALAQAFNAAGFKVSEGESPWRLGPADAALSAQLLAGVAQAVGETGMVSTADLAGWLTFRTASLAQPGSLMVTGHRDTFAMRD